MVALANRPLRLAAAAAILTGAAAQNSVCFGRSDADDTPCDDDNPNTHEDHCYQGFCGGWMPVRPASSPNILSETDRPGE